MAIGLAAGDSPDRWRKIIEELEQLRKLVQERFPGLPVQAFYSVEEFAQRVGLSSHRVQVLCWQGRILAKKTGTQAGPHQRWAISHAEYERYLSEGLRKLKKRA